MTSHDALMEELSGLNLQDDRQLIGWLERIFMTAHDDEVEELPDRHQIASTIGRARKLVPDPDLPETQPNARTGDPDLAAWLIQRAVNLGITAAREDALPLGVAYWAYAEAARDYLGRDQSA